MLFRFEGIPQKTKSGDNSAEETPVPISNTAVKLRSADDTWREAARESRSLPVLVKKKLHNGVASFFRFARHGRALTDESPEHAQIVGSV